MKYMPSLHAINRAVLRYGVPSPEVIEWVNERMKDAIFVGKSDTHKHIYESIDGIRMIIDVDTNAVVTILNTISTEFLAPIMEREKRKLHRKYTRQIRKLELEYAERLTELAEMAINRAKARNPKIRDIIAERITNVQRIINELSTEIERLNDEMSARMRAIEVIAE